jgi:hypothetical protein
MIYKLNYKQAYSGNWNLQEPSPKSSRQERGLAFPKKSSAASGHKPNAAECKPELVRNYQDMF